MKARGGISVRSFSPSVKQSSEDGTSISKSCEQFSSLRKKNKNRVFKVARQKCLIP